MTDDEIGRAYRQWARRLEWYAQRCVGSRELGQDLAAAVWERVLRKRPDGLTFAYLVAALRWVIGDYAKAQGRQRRILKVDPTGLVTHLDSRTETSCDPGELLRTIQEQLTPNQQQLLAGTAYGWTPAVLGELHNMSRHAVDSQLTRARVVMRRALAVA